MNELIIRYLWPCDVPYISKIEKDCFGNFAWSGQDFYSCLRNPICQGYVATWRGVVIGYAITTTDDDMTLLENLAVAKPFRRQGVATALLAKIRRVTEEPPQDLSAVVRESNEAAHMLLDRRGFLFAHRAKYYYAETDEDALVFLLNRDQLRPRVIPRARLIFEFTTTPENN